MYEEKHQSILQAYALKEASARDDYLAALNSVENEDEEDKLHDDHYDKLDTLRRQKDVELSEMVPVEKVKLKTTLILTSLSLMGQW